jgi:ATP-dependent exoDNAse (exonuclease V) alpha subunit
MTPEQTFLEAAHAGKNVFLTGMAGTGKSHLLRQLLQEQRASAVNGKLILFDGVRQTDVTAPTGIAALNIGGMTVHRWAGIGIGPAAGQSNADFARQLREERRPSQLAARRRIERCQTLVIDEISMLSGRHLEFLDYWMRQVRDAAAVPFGGVQLIVIGDFMQLPPVRTTAAPYDWAFQAAAWAAAGFVTVVLTTVRRQADARFASALGQFRLGRIAECAPVLGRRVCLFPPGDITRLLTTNLAVDKWNLVKLSEIENPLAEYRAEESGDARQLEFLKKNLLTPALLQVKVGAKVMFTRNDPAGQYVNGLTGVVEDMNCNMIQVATQDGRTVGLERAVWNFDPSARDTATFKQFPLRLAYAVTIHKSQGMTMDAAYIDIRAAREPGQAYVALSRVRTLAGLYLKEWPRGVWVSDEASKFYTGGNV